MCNTYLHNITHFPLNIYTKYVQHIPTQHYIFFCCNSNIGFVIKCEVQGPMRPSVCLGVKHTFTNGGICKGWNPMTPKCTPTLKVTLMWKLWMFRALVDRQTNAKLGPQEPMKKILKHRCLKHPHFAHLKLICMSYDQKKGHESNWVFDSWPQIPKK